MKAKPEQRDRELFVYVYHHTEEGRALLRITFGSGILEIYDSDRG